MSLNDILIIERERVRRERVVLTTVYERMKNRINSSVRARAKECIYTIPEFIPGYPLINITKTMDYLVSKLKREGFIVMPISILDLYITWDPIKIRQLDEHLRSIEPKKRDQINYSTNNISASNTSSTSSNRTSLNRKVVEKEFERASEDFINSLVVSKRNEKN